MGRLISAGGSELNRCSLQLTCSSTVASCRSVMTASGRGHWTAELPETTGRSPRKFVRRPRLHPTDLRLTGHLFRGEGFQGNELTLVRPSIWRTGTTGKYRLAILGFRIPADNC
jgi:hypothetical protein